MHLDHVLASGALPPAFPAVRIEGEAYWDGGIYSNTPIEAVLDDKPRRDSVIFAVQMWDPRDPSPNTVAGHGPQKDIHTRAARAATRAAEADPSPAACHPRAREQAARERAAHRGGAGARVVGLRHDDARRPAHGAEARRRGSHEGHRLHAAGIRARWQAGYADAKRMLERAPWNAPVGPTDSILIHEDPRQTMPSLAEGVDGFAGQTKYDVRVPGMLQ